MNDKMAELAEQQTLDTLTPETQTGALPAVVAQANNLMENTKLLNNIYKMANVYSKSSMVPANYQNKPENCFVAIELSGRMGVSPTLVMQNLIIVQGKPSWAGQACIALINGCGKFSHELDFVEVGEREKDTWGCYCVTHRKADSRELRGETITIQMVKDEGWLNKNGSKWKTMPGQMLKYRAASFFARTYCPEVLMGFSTADEVEDITPEKQTTHVKL